MASQDSSNKNILWISIIAGLVIILVALLIYGNRDNSNTKDTETADTTESDSTDQTVNIEDATINEEETPEITGQPLEERPVKSADLDCTDHEVWAHDEPHVTYPHDNDGDGVHETCAFPDVWDPAHTHD